MLAGPVIAAVCLKKKDIGGEWEGREPFSLFQHRLISLPLGAVWMSTLFGCFPGAAGMC